MITTDYYYPDADMINRKMRELIKEEIDAEIKILFSKLIRWILDTVEESKQDDDDQFNNSVCDDSNDCLYESQDISAIIKSRIPDVKCSKDRVLRIYVWGKRLRKTVPSQYKVQ